MIWIHFFGQQMTQIEIHCIFMNINSHNILNKTYIYNTDITSYCE